VTPERQMSSNEHQTILCTNSGTLPSAFLTLQPNKTKLPLQVLAIIEENSEKIRFVG